MILDINKLKTLVYSIGMWKEVAKIPDGDAGDKMNDDEIYNPDIERIKRMAMKKIGKYKPIKHLCFCCEYRDDTNHCPLGVCTPGHRACLKDYSYGKWEETLQQRHARAFYYELWLVYLKYCSSLYEQSQRYPLRQVNIQNLKYYLEDSGWVEEPFGQVEVLKFRSPHSLFEVFIPSKRELIDYDRVVEIAIDNISAYEGRGFEDVLRHIQGEP